MKVYEAVYSDEEKQGVYGISLVENPAMQDEWIALSEQEQKIEFAAVDETQHLLLGAVLIPDKKIYRNIGGNEFYITFTEDTIGDLAHDFIKKGFQNNSSSEHETKLSDVSFVESWQVKDPNIDKSALYGKTYEKGTWVTMAKVSPEIYQQATNGTFNGFSIDALLGLEEINFNSNINMTKQDFLDAFKTLFTADEVVAEKQVEEVEVKAEEVVDEVSAEPSEEMNLDAIKETLADMLAQFSEDQNKKFDDFKTEFSKQVEEKDVEVKELKAELNKQPEVEPIVAQPEAASVQLTAQGELLTLMRNNK